MVTPPFAMLWLTLPEFPNDSIGKFFRQIIQNHQKNGGKLGVSLEGNITHSLFADGKNCCKLAP